MIVADIPLVAGRFIPGVNADLARRVYARDTRWAVPRVWRVHFRDALAAQVRGGGLRLEDALAVERAAFAELRSCDVELENEMVLRLAARSGRPAEECEYVALAHFLAVRMVTANAAVLKAFPEHTIHPDQFLATADAG